MQAIRSKGSRIERELARELWKCGLRYRKNDKGVPGTPDFTFRGVKLAVFVDSEFWHGKDWDKKKEEFRSKREFWLPKIERNIKRDEEVNLVLRREAWHVLRFWGKEVLADSVSCALRVREAVFAARMERLTDPIS